MPARTMHPQARIDEYTAKGYWSDETVQQLLTESAGAAIGTDCHDR